MLKNETSRKKKEKSFVPINYKLKKEFLFIWCTLPPEYNEEKVNDCEYRTMFDSMGCQNKRI
jgi:hypothetical protein